MVLNSQEFAISPVNYRSCFQGELGEQGRSSQPKPESQQDLGLCRQPPSSGARAEQGFSPRDGREPPGK